MTLFFSIVNWHLELKTILENAVLFA